MSVAAGFLLANVDLSGTKSEWGPRLWRFLFALAEDGDVNSRKGRSTLIGLLFAIPEVLPCPECAVHARRWLARKPPPVHNRLLLRRWIAEWRENIRASK